MSLLVGPLSYGESYKITVGLSVCPSVWYFSQKWLISFFWFLANLKNRFCRKWTKMETNIITDISPPIPYLAKFWFLSYGPKCCQPIKLQDFLKCNISKKKWMMKFIFGMQIKTKSSTSWYYHFGCVKPGMPKVPKIKS